MERVAFLIEQTGERVFAMINPDELIFERRSGVRMRQRHDMPLARARRSDDPMIYVGGGTTDLTLNLLFDVDLLARSSPSFSRSDSVSRLRAQPVDAPALSALAESDLRADEDAATIAPVVPPPVTDVRDLSGPLWRLTENGADSPAAGPPIVHFIWGAAWNVPCVALSIAERFDQFAADGTPLRSWVRMRLRRTHLPASTARATDLSIAPVRSSGASGPPAESLPESVVLMDPTTSSRPDLICDSVYGDVRLLHPLLQFNDIDDFWSLEPGRTLITPPASVLRNEP